ncbi:MAG: VWA domain-containing protein [Betaproteobacteria bacterium]|nr:VWA domain-containing protein [Betaproteobacteria bacterium]
MTLLWPTLLWLLLFVPLIVVFYLRLVARQRNALSRFASLALAMQETGARPAGDGSGASGPDAAGGGAKGGGAKGVARAWAKLAIVMRVHGAAILMLLGLTTMIFAVARPQAVVMLPSRLDAIILAMDVSGSMRATDIAPNRLAAAQAAARAFIADQPSEVRIGVVAIAASASLAQAPTDKREDIINAIERFQLQRGTALGSGLVIALSTLLPEGGIDVEKIISGKSAERWTRDWARQKQIDNFKPVPPGSNGATAIVLLSDGQSNTGPELLEAAKLAAERGVRVYTVGIGTTQGTTLSVDGWSMRVRLDEETLKKVSMMTRGEYFRAANAGELKKIYQGLSGRLALTKGRATELTSVVVAIGAALALLGALLSVLRSNRIL